MIAQIIKDYIGLDNIEVERIAQRKPIYVIRDRLLDLHIMHCYTDTSALKLDAIKDRLIGLRVSYEGN